MEKTIQLGKLRLSLFHSGNNNKRLQPATSFTKFEDAKNIRVNLDQVRRGGKREGEEELLRSLEKQKEVEICAG
jgi:hypothetical protein